MLLVQQEKTTRPDFFLALFDSRLILNSHRHKLNPVTNIFVFFFQPLPGSMTLDYVNEKVITY